MEWDPLRILKQLARHICWTAGVPLPGNRFAPCDRRGATWSTGVPEAPPYPPIHPRSLSPRWSGGPVFKEVTHLPVGTLSLILLG